MSLKRRVRQLEHRAAAEDDFTPPAPLSLRSPADVVDLLAEQAEAVRRDPHADPLDRARTLGFVGALALRAMDAAEGRARLDALERALKLRTEQHKAEAKRLMDQRRR
jgi:hypothetical protein